MTKDTVDVRDVTSLMRRRAKWAQYHAYVLLVITLGIATYAFLFFAFDFTEPNIVTDMMNTEIGPGAVLTTVPEMNIYYFFTRAILNLGAVLLAVYLFQLLFSLIRHLVKLAEDLALRADMIELCFDDADKLNLVSSVVALDGIHIGSMPDHPYGKIADAIKEVAAKLPGK